MDGSPNLSQIYSGGPGFLFTGVRILTACLGWMNGQAVLINPPQVREFDSRAVFRERKISLIPN